MSDDLYCMFADGNDEVCAIAAQSKVFTDLTDVGMRICVPMCDKHSAILDGLAHASGLIKTDDINDIEH